MKKELLVLAMLIGACSASCQDAMSAPVESLETIEQCLNELQIEKEVSIGCDIDLNECESRCISAPGETVDLEPDTENSEQVIYDEAKYELAVALGEVRNLKEANALLNAQIDGLQDEYSKLEDKLHETSSLFIEYQELYNTHNCGVYQTVEVNQ